MRIINAAVSVLALAIISGIGAADAFSQTASPGGQATCYQSKQDGVMDRLVTAIGNSLQNSDSEAYSDAYPNCGKSFGECTAIILSGSEAQLWSTPSGAEKAPHELMSVSYDYFSEEFINFDSKSGSLMDNGAVIPENSLKTAFECALGANKYGAAQNQHKEWDVQRDAAVKKMLHDAVPTNSPFDNIPALPR